MILFPHSMWAPGPLTTPRSGSFGGGVRQNAEGDWSRDNTVKRHNGSGYILDRELPDLHGISQQVCYLPIMLLMTKLYIRKLAQQLLQDWQPGKYMFLILMIRTQGFGLPQVFGWQKTSSSQPHIAQITTLLSVAARINTKPG